MTTNQLPPPIPKPNNEVMENEIVFKQQINENSLLFKELHSDILSLYPSALTLREFREHRKDFIAAQLGDRKKKDRNMKLDIGDRANMVDWMVQVAAIFECSKITFFRTLNIIDKFYVKTGG